MKVGYDPKRSKVSDDKLAEFIRSAITGDITEVSLMPQKIVIRGAKCNRRDSKSPTRRVFLPNMSLRVIPGMGRRRPEVGIVYNEPNGTNQQERSC